MDQLRKAAGYFLIVLSFPVWGAIVALPWLDLSIAEAAAVATALIVAGEAMFYLGIVLLGKEIWDKIKQHLLPFARKKKTGTTLPAASSTDSTHAD